MRARVARLLLLAIAITGQLTAQQTGSSSSDTQSTTSPQQDAQAVALVNQASLALTSGTAVSDVLLNGTVSWQDGPKLLTGTAVLEVKGSGESRLDITTGDQKRSEVRNDSNGHAGEWVGTDGQAHRMAGQNSLIPAAWFAPQAVLALMSSPDAVLSYVGQETRNGLAVNHVRYERQIVLAVPDSVPQRVRDSLPDLSKLTVVDLYLDPASQFPSSITYNLHLDNNANKNIPVEVRYADYRVVNGIRFPFRIQRLMLNALDLDINLSSVAVNSGLSDTDFALKSAATTFGKR